MQLTIAIQGGQEDILLIEASPESTIATVKERIEFQSGYPAVQQILMYESNRLSDDKRTLQACGVIADSMLEMWVQPESSGAGEGQTAPTGRNQIGQGQGPSSDEMERNRQAYLNNPSQLDNLRIQFPRLANAVHDSANWRNILQNFDPRAERARDFAALEADPYNEELQKRVEELIRLDNVQKNFEQTQEYHPEAFGRVHMLYVDVEVNGNKVKAFVDSGAQATIMSPGCATKCGIMRLLDTRYGGIARGVGTAKILGRVHSASIKVGSSFLPCAFTVMEGKDVDLLLGLDMLKRYQACIDLQKGALLIQGDVVPFLGEADLPKMEMNEPTVEGPSGVKTGAISGAVSQPSGDKPAQSSTSTTQQGASSSQKPQSTPGPSSFPSADIAKLIDMGFSREEALQALTISGGDVDGAAGYLL